MNLSLKKDEFSGDIIIRLEDDDLRSRVESGVFDRIVTKLADKYVEKYGEKILHDIIDVRGLKEEVAAIIKKRILDETSAKVQK